MLLVYFLLVEFIESFAQIIYCGRGQAEIEKKIWKWFIKVKLKFSLVYGTGRFAVKYLVQNV